MLFWIPLQALVQRQMSSHTKTIDHSYGVGCSGKMDWSKEVIFPSDIDKGQYWSNMYMYFGYSLKKDDIKLVECSR